MIIDLPTEENPVTIIHGDCLEVMKWIPAGVVDAVITDPPYGVGAGEMSLGKWRTSKMPSESWDNTLPDLSALVAMKCPKIIWGSNYFNLPPSRKYLVWDKGAGFKGRDFAECEVAWCSFDGNAKVFAYDPLAGRDYHNKLHPTQKPFKLFKWCVEQLPGKVDVILDAYAGSGTLGEAAIACGKKAILIEKSPRYVEIIRKRVALALGRDKSQLFHEVA